MAPPYRDARHFFSALAKMAEELRQAIIPMTEAERAELVTRIVDTSEMAFGVWPDAEADDGVGLAIIKGDDIMPPLVGFETEHEVSLAAIPCVDREVALAAKEALRADDPEAPGAETLSASTALSISEVARLSWVKRSAARSVAPAS